MSSASTHSHSSHHSHRLGDGTLTGQDFEEGLGHTLELSVLRNVFVTLLVLTVVTVVVSRFDFGSFNAIVAIVIATIKAGLVATFFMHLKFEGKIIWMYVVYPLMILFLLVGGTFGDYAERRRIAPFNESTALPAVVIPSHGSANGHPVDTQNEPSTGSHSTGNHSTANHNTGNNSPEIPAASSKH